jgi:lysophospholipase L1-like esterase
MSEEKSFPYSRFVKPFLPLTFAVVLVMLFAPAALASPRPHISLVGPKSRYLALGDSLAFGYQPDLNYDDGYADDFYANLQGHSVSTFANLGCPGETSVTFLNGKCPVPILRKFPYIGSQLNAALLYLALHPGQVSPVTLDIGANDISRDINTKTCATNTSQFASDLATLDANLTQTILPQLHNALMVNGKLTGDLVVMNYYDPYQNICPNTVAYSQTVNQHIANDVSGYGTVADVFSAFGGATTPNPNICSYTWECSIFHDIHSTDTGYSVIASTFENTVGY